MTPKEFRKSISESARNLMSKKGIWYNDIQIDYRLPYIAIGELFFAQGQDASELIDQATITSNQTNLKIETCIVWYLESAGALS